MTGHRTLTDEASLRQAVGEVLAVIGRRHPDRRLRILSSLAEGADRLVADVARREFDAELSVILPMPEADYVADFPQRESVAHFRDLLAAATAIETLPLQERREDSYARAGAAVVEGCDVLVAVWDGLPARGSGGTAQVVDLARRRGLDVYWIECRGDVTWTLIGSGRSAGETAMTKNGMPFRGGGENDHGDWGLMFEESRAAIASVADAQTMEQLERRYRQVVAHFRTDYDLAEARADRLQSVYRRASTAVLILAAAAVLIATVQTVFHLDRLVSLGEIAAIALVLVIFQFGARREWHIHWMEARLEAEWLRQSIFTAFLSGARSPGIDRHWACRWVQGSASVRKVRALWDGLPDLGRPPAAALPFLKAFMAGAWLRRQREYHERKQNVEAAKHRRISTAGEAFFWATFVAAIVHVLPPATFHGLHLDEQRFETWLAMVGIGLPAIAAALTGLRCHFEYQKLSSRSAMMADHLRHLEQELHGVGTIDGLSSLVRDVETLMLQENSDWYFLIGQHHIEKA